MVPLGHYNRVTIPNISISVNYDCVLYLYVCVFIFITFCISIPYLSVSTSIFILLLPMFLSLPFIFFTFLCLGSLLFQISVSLLCLYPYTSNINVRSIYIKAISRIISFVTIIQTCAYTIHRNLITVYIQRMHLSIDSYSITNTSFVYIYCIRTST
jgi:hypothetical protein